MAEKGDTMDRVLDYQLVILSDLRYQQQRVEYAEFAVDTCTTEEHADWQDELADARKARRDAREAATRLGLIV
jgi:hypothetical protein